MTKNQLFLNYLMLIFCFSTFYGVIQAQPGCSEKDWCLHSVEIKNTSCCEVEVWCQEIGCDGQNYYMGKLASGKTFSGQPNAYGAKFKIANNGNYVHEFPQLDRDGYCHSYSFKYEGSSGSCSKPSLQTSGDQHICAGQSVEICADGADHYWWSNDKDKRCITVSPSKTETYTVKGVKNGCEATAHVTVNVSDRFYMSLSDDQTICKGQSIEICASDADGYHWSNGKQSSCITVSPDHTKTYSVTGTKNGCEDTNHITVNVNGSFNLGVDNDQTICSGQSVEICASGADGYWWSTGDDKKCITVSPHETTTYQVTGIKNGCEGSGHIKVTVNDKFSMPSSDDQTICKGQSIEICASNAEGYYWGNGKESSCITVSPDHTKTYTVTGYKNGCEDTDHITVNVNGSFNLGIDNDKTICSDQSVEICASGADGYWWNTGDDKKCITVSPHETTTYQVTGIKNGCEGSGHIKVSVNDKFSMSSSDDQTICKGQSIEICASDAEGYYWGNGKESSCITVSPDHTKTYTVTGYKNGCEDIDHITVSVNDSFNLGTDNDKTICSGQSVKICANGADGYWWSTGDDSRCITVSPSHTKTYKVTGTKNGCEGSGDITVSVNDSFNLGTDNDKTICSGQSVKICANGADGYWWSTGEGKKCITVHPTHTKTYSVVGFKNGCEDNGEITVHVNDSFNLHTSDDSTIHAGESVEICASGADGYWWSNGKEKACIWVSPDKTTTYSVKGIKNGCEGFGEVTVHVNQANNTCSIDDIKLEEWSIGSDKAVIAWTKYSNVWYTLHIRSKGSNKWQQFDTDRTDVELTGLKSCRTYEWAISVKCSNGVVSDVCDIRTFKTSGHCGYNRLTNQDVIGFNQSMGETLNSIQVYPNPATNLLRVDYKGISVNEIAIYNNMGKLIEKAEVDASGLAIVKVKNYTSGVYLIMAQANDKLYKNVFVVN